MSAILRLALIVSLLAAFAAQGYAMTVPGGHLSDAAGMHPAMAPGGHLPAPSSPVDCDWMCTADLPAPGALSRPSSTRLLPAAPVAAGGLLPSGITPELPDPPPRPAAI